MFESLIKMNLICHEVKHQITYVQIRLSPILGEIYRWDWTQ